MRWEAHAAHIRDMKIACKVHPEILKVIYCMVDMCRWKVLKWTLVRKL
jgi:hypothetical protein